MGEQGVESIHARFNTLEHEQPCGETKVHYGRTLPTGLPC